MAAVLLLLIANVGCAVRAPQTYRLVRKDTGRVLIPPGVANPDLPRRVFQADVSSGPGACPAGEGAIEIRPQRNRARITVNRDALLRQPLGWLSRWTALAEAQGCIAAGEGLKLATEIDQALPLDPAAAYRLLHANDRQTGYVDLGPEHRLQVNSAIMRKGTPPDAPAIESAKIIGLTVEVKSSPDLLGFETAWYAIRPKPNGIGFTIAPISAERHIQGRTEPTSAPKTNHLQFSPQAAFYRLYYKADQSITVVAAATRAELDRETQALTANPNACERFAARMCVPIPRGVAVNPDLIVTVNSREIAVPVGATVQTAIQVAGEKDAQGLLPRLTVRKLYAGKPVAVTFDPAGADILGLILSGGEQISWQ